MNMENLLKDKRGRKPVLTEEQIKEIETLIRNHPKIILTRIAEEYQVSRATISKIKKNMK